MRTLMIVRRYRCVIEKDKDQCRDRDGRDRDNDRLSRRSSADSRARASTSRDRRNSNSNDKDKEGTKETFTEEGFMQICGPTTEREMQAIQDIMHPLEEAPYKLQCTCPHCISYSYEMTSSQKQFTEPFMRAINLIFSTIRRHGYTLQSTSSVQNADESSTTTWVWIRTEEDRVC